MQSNYRGSQRPIVPVSGGVGSVEVVAYLNITGGSSGDTITDDTASWNGAVIFGVNCWIQFGDFGGFVGTPGAGDRSYHYTQDFQLEFLDADDNVLATVTETRDYQLSHSNATTLDTQMATRTDISYSTPTIAGWAKLRLTLTASESHVNYTSTSIVVNGHVRVLVPYPLGTQIVDVE